MLPTVLTIFKQTLDVRIGKEGLELREEKWNQGELCDLFR